MDWYLAQTGQELVGGQVDAVASASKKAEGQADSTPGVDAVAGASKKDTAPAKVPVAAAQVDGVSSASEK